MARRLVVIRHASARTHGESDHARVLTRRGLIEATELAGLLASAGLCPDVALVSSATRAQQTWAPLGDRCEGCRVDVSDGLYAAGSEAVLEAVRLVPEDSRTVVYVGHNPTASYLAATLPDGTVSTEALSHIVGGMPPASAVVFEVEPAWADLDQGTARVLQVLHPGS